MEERERERERERCIFIRKLTKIASKLLMGQKRAENCAPPWTLVKQQNRNFRWLNNKNRHFRCWEHMLVQETENTHSFVGACPESKQRGPQKNRVFHKSSTVSTWACAWRLTAQIGLFSKNRALAPWGDQSVILGGFLLRPIPLLKYLWLYSSRDHGPWTVV